MIKAKLSPFVKAAPWLFSLLVLTGPLHPNAYSETIQQKEIDAQEFKISAKKKSTSGRVVLFDEYTEISPKVGKILLLKESSTEIAAVRVLKVYPEKKFAAKNVLPFQQIELGKEYRALKKVGEKYINLIRERERRMDDPDRLKTDDELSKEVSPEDAELDRGIPAPAKKENGPSDDETLDQPMTTTPDKAKPSSPKPLFDGKGNELGGEEADSLIDDDDYDTDPFSDTFMPLEPHAHAVSFEYASMLNYDATNKPVNYSALGFRYSYILSRYWFLDQKTTQDYLAFEAGLFFYSVAAYQSPEDTVSVLPIHLSLRYNVNLGEYFSPYLYGGFVKNNVTSVSSPYVNTSNLNRTVPAFGFGAMFKLGPGWSVRASLGTEGFAAGILLRFQ